MINALSILKSILDFKKCFNICFLCLKSLNGTTSIYSELEIIGESFNLNLSLANVMEKILPSHEIFFDQACEECTNLILKLFIKLHGYKKNVMVFKSLLNDLDKKLQNVNPCDTNELYIKINKHDTEMFEGEKNDLIQYDNIKSFDCDKCDMKFDSIEALRKHKNLHKETHKATICDVCGKTFKTSMSLKAHVNCHKVKACPYCSKILKTHSHYNIHLKNHVTSVKKRRNKHYYTCNNCDYKTLNKKTLEAHINKIHLKIRPYVCETCYKAFYKKSNLTEHINTHSQIKNKTCEICGDQFCNEKTLIEHQRLHSDYKPYECNVCGKKFVTSGRRSDHMKSSHMEKTECCLFCDKRFSLRKELNRHVKKVHADGLLTISNFDVDDSNYKFDNTIVFPGT